MSIKKFFAAQLRQPSGLFGRFITLYFLNRHNYKLNSLVFRSFQLCPDDHVLEVGFGGGALMSNIAEVVNKGHITGVDFSEEAVEFCSIRFQSKIKTGLIDLQCADVGTLPLAANEYTKACAVNAIYFWPNPVLALQQIHRVLKQNGLLVIGFKSRSVLKKGKITRYGFKLYEPHEVEALLREAGFRDVKCVSEGNGLDECTVAVGKK